MLDKLIKLANYLDSKSLVKEADYLDLIIKKSAKPIMSVDEMQDFHLVKNPDEPIIIEAENGTTYELKIEAINHCYRGDWAEGSMDYTIDGEEYEWEFYGGWSPEGAVSNIFDKIKGVEIDLGEYTPIEIKLIKDLEQKIFVNPNYNEERDCPDEPDYERD